MNALPFDHYSIYCESGESVTSSSSKQHMKRPDSSSSLFPVPPHSLENNQEDYYQVMNKMNTASQLWRQICFYFWIAKKASKFLNFNKDGNFLSNMYHITVILKNFSIINSFWKFVAFYIKNSGTLSFFLRIYLERKIFDFLEQTLKIYVAKFWIKFQWIYLFFGIYSEEKRKLFGTRFE